MVYRRIASILAALAAALALLGGCDAETATFAVDKGNLDLALDQVVSLQVFPVRREYALEGDSIAKTEEHLRVFAVHYNGNTLQTPLRDTEVTLNEGDIITLTEQDPHPFSSSGEKMVTVSYKDQSARYTIIVRSESVPGVTPGPSTDGGTSIIFEPKW
jgi:hypothetical protein